jgi:hypothetical protein
MFILKHTLLQIKKYIKKKELVSFLDKMIDLKFVKVKMKINKVKTQKLFKMNNFIE